LPTNPRNVAPVARVNGDEPRAVALMHSSRAIRATIADAAGIAECDAELSRIAALP